MTAQEQKRIAEERSRALRYALGKINDMRASEEDKVKSLTTVGITYRDAEGSMKPLREIMKEIADKMFEETEVD